MSSKSIIVDNEFLLENLQGGVVYSDAEPPFRLRYCTEGMANLSGYSVEELLNMYQMDLVYEQDIDTLMEEVGAQLSVGDTFCVEYRLKRKDGTIVYILDKAKSVMHEDNCKYIHCLLTDISDYKKMEQALWLSQEKYKLALKQSGNVILEIDLQTNSCVFSENYESVFDAPMPTGTVSEIVNDKWLEPTCVEGLLSMFDEVISKNVSESTELRIRQKNGECVWGSLQLMPLFNTRGKLYSIVGCLKNIDKEKQHLSFLTERSEKDGLTGIYNRTFMEEKINHFIELDNNKGALIIIDIDFFKVINDSRGHIFGDAVLKNLVEVVKNTLPIDSFFGRLGGDEFLIFVPDIDSRDKLAALSVKIINDIALANEQNLFMTKVTLSIGASIVDSKTNDFDSLYRRADKALYTTKEKGRNSHTIV